MTRTNLAAAALLSSLLAGTAQAALFRCGNVFQDRPCDAGVEQQLLRPGGGGNAASGGPSAATRASPFAAACGRVGEHAQRIAWKREGGATLERQVADLPAGSDRQELAAIAEAVYARRGSATEIRAAVEAECVQRKTEAAQAAEVLGTLQRQAGQGLVEGVPSANGAPAPAGAPAAAAPVAAGPVRTAAGPDACPALREQARSIEERLRSGGRVETMEALQRQRRDNQKRQSDAGC